jgi:cardiolipin synthase
LLSQIPNILTIIRIVLILPFALYVYREQYGLALIVFFVAGLSDGVDGFLARQFNWKSRFGAIADPLADKLLLITAYVVLALTSQIPVWLTVIILSRDLVIVAGALIYHYFISHYDIKPSIFGKACTMAQIVYALAVIIKLAGGPMPDEVISYGLWCVLFITLLSGFQYVLVWSSKGLKELRERQKS